MNEPAMLTYASVKLFVIDLIDFNDWFYWDGLEVFFIYGRGMMGMERRNVRYGDMCVER